MISLNATFDLEWNNSVILFQGIVLFDMTAKQPTPTQTHTHCVPLCTVRIPPYAT